MPFDSMNTGKSSQRGKHGFHSLHITLPDIFVLLHFEKLSTMTDVNFALKPIRLLAVPNLSPLKIYKKANVFIHLISN